METFSELLTLCAGNSPITGEFPAKRPVTPSFDVFCDLRLNKRLSKQSWGWWFDTPSRPLWRHCNDVTIGHTESLKEPCAYFVRYAVYRNHPCITCAQSGHHSVVIMGRMAFQITSLTNVYSTVYSGPDQRKHQSSASLAFVGRIHRWPVNSPHKGPVTRKCFHLITSSLLIMTLFPGRHAVFAMA